MVRDEVTERAFVVLPSLSADGARNARFSRDPAQRLAETVGLTEAIGLRVEGSMLVKLERPHARAYVGTGKVEGLRSLIGAYHVSVVICDEALSPVQQRNREQSWQVKVRDRIGLIREIFGSRAKTRE